MLLIKPSWWARVDVGPPDPTDRSRARHPEGVRRFTSHTRSERPSPSCQPAPGQPLPHLQAVQYDSAAVTSGVIIEGGNGSVCLPGTYHRLPDDVAALVLAQHHEFLPVFLHDTLAASTEVWIEPIASIHDEAGAVIRARDAIQQMMQSHLDSGTAVRASTTVPSTEETAKGLAVTGRGVYYRRNS